MPSLVEIGPLFLEKKILKININVLSLFRNYLPLEKGRVLYLNNNEIPSPNDIVCQIWLILTHWF